MSASFGFFNHNIALNSGCSEVLNTTKHPNSLGKGDDLGGWFAHNGQGTILYSHNYATPVGAGDDQDFERSYDYGRTWSTLSTLSRTTSRHLSKIEYHANSDTWVLAQWDNTNKLNNLKYSQDDGDTWTSFGANTGCGFSYSTGFFIRDDKLYHMGAGLSNTHWIESWDMPPGQVLPDVYFQTSVASNYSLYNRATVVFANYMFVINGQEGINGLFKIDKTAFGTIQKWNTVDNPTFQFPHPTIPWVATTRRAPFKAINANYAYYPGEIETTGAFADTAVYYKFEDSSAPTTSAWPTIQCDWSDTLTSDIECVDLTRNPDTDVLYMAACETQGVSGGQEIYIKQSIDEGVTWSVCNHVVVTDSGVRTENTTEQSTFQIFHLSDGELIISYSDYDTLQNSTVIVGVPPDANCSC